MPSEAHAVQVIDQPEHLPQVSESAPVSLLAVIARAARDPSVDIDKMNKLLEMQERIAARDAKLEFDRAMSLAQRDMQPIRADANNPQTRSKYASYFALDTAIRPIYTKHGFAISFDTGDGAAPDHVVVVANVSHTGGHREQRQISMPSDGKGAKGGDVMTKTHATGSAITYGKRYLQQMIWNLAVGGDDDGNAAGPGGYISAAQKDELVALIQETGADTARYLKVMKVASLDEIAACNFNRARNALLEKRAKMQQAAAK